LRAAVFDKLLPALGGRTRLLLAPGGEFTQLPFETLPTEDGRHLIDTWEMSYLTSGRDLLAYRVAPRRPPQPPLVVGDPDFAPAELGAKQPAAGGWLSWLLGRRKPTAPPAAGNGEGQGAESEPQTREEVRAVAGLLNTAPVVGVEVHKARLRAARSPRVLHLASPSFFLADPSPDGAAVRAIHPLRRSGLVLAGVKAWRRKPGDLGRTEDGLLSAEEITGLDLLATRLTVLSLTDATRNVEKATAGVAVLQRSFAQAGTRALVMSLWSVPDPPRRQLVEDLYRRLLGGVRGAAALRQARLALKATQPDPRVWGAFLFQGDPDADLSPG
jgi:CHAT domain-containing protein